MFSLRSLNRGKSSELGGGTGKGPVVVQAVKKTLAVQPARVLTRVDPTYPPEAKAQRLEGRVMLMVVVARGLRARDSARESGIYHAAGAVHAELQQRLDVRRKQVLG